MNDVAEYQKAAAARGYTYNYAIGRETVTPEAMRKLRVVESRSFDAGTDPGDDVTIYLIDAPRGRKGYLLVSDSFHTDPGKAAFLDALLAMQGRRN